MKLWIFWNIVKLLRIKIVTFFYAYKLDAERKLERIFWVPSHSFEWYQKFGDVVLFDTTYKVNSYDMPFGIFVGADINGRTIPFGCALLHNETTSTFLWLMKRQPKTIFTNQDPWITEAIGKEMPLTKDAFCIWHITAKISAFSGAGIHSWLFFWWQQREDQKALMHSSKRFVNSHACLTQQVDFVVEEIEQTQLHDTMLETYRSSSMRSMSPLEEQAHNILTPFSFKKFKKNLLGQVNIRSEQITKYKKTPIIEKEKCKIPKPLGCYGRRQQRRGEKCKMARPALLAFTGFPLSIGKEDSKLAIYDLN
ncbi:Protein FAR1-RELATED SEQUENCE 11 [Quillaja saponaria]|uniref:Protein FAR1-RELATED SEQUENCE n=1 Tax=Quillaja saponaria TaxID=32244 RepID=A0AAD7LU23_QUISA|nr:Protein FAR1-RELATED SEQUENCE 11 [Quillaja saponaria]